MVSPSFVCSTSKRLGQGVWAVRVQIPGSVAFGCSVGCSVGMGELVIEYLVRYGEYRLICANCIVVCVYLMRNSVRFSWEQAERPIVALAPMAGYTDSPFRQVVKSVAPGVICFSELTSVEALRRGSKKSYEMLDWDPSEFPLIVQLFGREPAAFEEMGKRVEELGAAGIDINMGCPTTKIVSTQCGSALLKNPQLAADTVHALTKAVGIPVSVKTRLGYESYDEERFLNFGTMMQDAGAKLITIHGRTRSQSFTGGAQWNPIYKLKDRLHIPVIGNGDIRSGADAVAVLGNLDGVMVGRATMGNPWVMREIFDALRGDDHDNGSARATSAPMPKTFLEKLPLIREHVARAVAFVGEARASRELRKQMACYISGFPGAKEFVRRAMLSSSEADMMGLLDEIESSFK